MHTEGSVLFWFQGIISTV